MIGHPTTNRCLVISLGLLEWLEWQIHCIDGARLDRLGVPHSDQLHVTERFRRVDRDHLQLEVTMQDPKALAKPWTGTLYYELRNDWDLGEISCSGDYLDFNTFESFSFKKQDTTK